MTREAEEYHFLKFQSLYNLMPSGTHEPSDKPDILFTSESGKQIGVEITECIYDELLMRHSEYQIKFNYKVIAQLEGKMPFKFHLDIELDKDHPLRQNEIEPTINLIIETCMNEFGDLKPYESRDVEQLDVNWDEGPIELQRHFHAHGYRKLPKGISSIQMGRYDSLSHSSHTEYKGGLVPDFTSELLNSILKKKNKAILDYKVCDEQWLLICEGSDHYSYIKDVSLDIGFDTQFDRVFMLRASPPEVIIIK